MNKLDKNLEEILLEYIRLTIAEGKNNPLGRRTFRYHTINELKSLIRETCLTIIGEAEELQEGQVMATPFNAIVLGKNELKAEMKQRLNKILGE